jgi:integrase
MKPSTPPKKEKREDPARGIYLRGSNYWLRYSSNGEQLRVPLRTSDLGEAVKRAAAERGRVPFDPNLHLQGALRRQLEEEQRAGRLSLRYVNEAHRRFKVLLDFHHDITKLHDITPRRLQEYLDHVRKQRKPTTLNTYAGQLRGIFSLMVRRRHLAHNPMDDVRLPAFNQAEHVRDNVVPGEVAARLIKKCKDPRLKYVLLAGFCLGMRKNEIIESRWGWFNLQARVCLIPPEARKRSKLACPPLNSDVLAHLEKMKRALPKPPLPTDYILEPGVVAGDYRYRWDFRKPFMDFMAANKVNCTAHDMRRSFCTAAVRNGATLEQLSAWVGDSARVLASHYAHLKSYSPLVENILK